jgi:hypothetical protein
VIIAAEATRSPLYSRIYCIHSIANQLGLRNSARRRSVPANYSIVTRPSTAYHFLAQANMVCQYGEQCCGGLRDQLHDNTAGMSDVRIW